MNDYPIEAVNIAKEVLQFKAENPSMKCGTRVGWARANQIAKKENLSEETIKRTYSFLSRAKAYDTGSFTNKDGSFACGSIMYAAWGGDPMLTWAKEKVQKLNSMKKIEITGTIGYAEGSKDYFDYVYSSVQPTESIEVEISSLGGDLFTAFHIYSKLKRHKGKTKATYVGLCASAATIIASACDEISMYDTGAILIHDASAYVEIIGRMKESEIAKMVEELGSTINDVDTYNLLMAKMYEKKTGKGTDELLSLMKEDRWILSDEALELGLVDKVITDTNGIAAKVKIAAAKKINDMNLKETIKNFFSQSKEQIVFNEESANALAVSISNEVDAEIGTMQSKVESIATDMESIAANIETFKTETVTALDSKIASIEKRQEQISAVLSGFLDGLNKSIESKLNEQEKRLESLVNELQLKENSIVTGDATFEEPMQPQDWINQLSNLKKR